MIFWRFGGREYFFDYSCSSTAIIHTNFFLSHLPSFISMSYYILNLYKCRYMLYRYRYLYLHIHIDIYISISLCMHTTCLHVKIDRYILQIFFLVCGWSFYFLTVSFEELKCLILTKSNLSIFFFMVCEDIKYINLLFQ